MAITDAQKIQIILSAIDTASSVIAKFRGNYEAEMTRVSEATQRIEGDTSRLRSTLSTLAVTIGSFGVGKFLLGVSEGFNQLRAGLETAYKSADKAKQVFSSIEGFATKTPFQLRDVTDAWLRLKNFGLTPTLGTIRTLGDAAGGNVDKFNGITLALGQIQAKGKLSAEELLQLTEKGIPAYQILSEKLKLSAKEVANIGNAGIGANEAIAALLEGMNERYGGGMAKMAQTLSGMWSNLIDSIEIAIDRLMNAGVTDSLKKVVSDVGTAISNLTSSGELEEWGRRIGEAIQFLWEKIKELTAFVYENREAIKDLVIAYAGMKIITTVGGAMLNLAHTVSLAVLAIRALVFMWPVLSPVLGGMLTAVQGIAGAIGGKLLPLLAPMISVAGSVAVAAAAVAPFAIEMKKSIDAIKESIAADEEAMRTRQLAAEKVMAYNKATGALLYTTKQYQEAVNELNRRGFDVKNIQDLIREVEAGNIAWSKQKEQFLGLFETTEGLKQKYQDLTNSIGKSSVSLLNVQSALYKLRQEGVVSSQTTNAVKTAYLALAEAVADANQALAQNKKPDLGSIQKAVGNLEEAYKQLNKEVKALEKTHREAVAEAKKAWDDLSKTYESLADSMERSIGSATDAIIADLERQKAALIKPGDIGKILKIENDIREAKISQAKATLDALLPILEQRYAEEKKFAEAAGKDIEDFERKSLEEREQAYLDYAKAVRTEIQGLVEEQKKLTEEIKAHEQAILDARKATQQKVDEVTGKTVSEQEKYYKDLRKSQEDLAAGDKALNDGRYDEAKQYYESVQELAKELNKEVRDQNGNLMRSQAQAQFEAIQKIQEAGKGLEEIEKRQADTKKKALADIKQQVQESLASLDQVQKKVQEIQGQLATAFKAEILVDTKHFDETLEAVKKAAADLEAVVKIKGELDQAFQETLTELKKFEEEPLEPKVDVKVEGQRLVDELRTSIEKIIEMTRNPIRVKVEKEVTSTTGRAEGRLIDGFSTGGSVFRRRTGYIPGYTRHDVLPAMLRLGEYVHTPETVQEYGLDFHEALRARALPQEAVRALMANFRAYADGGLVGFATGGLAAPGEEARLREQLSLVQNRKRSVTGERDKIRLEYSERIRQAKEAGDEKLAGILEAEKEDLRKLMEDLQKKLEAIEVALKAQLESLQERKKAIREQEAQRMAQAEQQVRDLQMKANEAMIGPNGKPFAGKYAFRAAQNAHKIREEAAKVSQERDKIGAETLAQLSEVGKQESEAQRNAGDQKQQAASEKQTREKEIREAARNAADEVRKTLDEELNALKEERRKRLSEAEDQLKTLSAAEAGIKGGQLSDLFGQLFEQGGMVGALEGQYQRLADYMPDTPSMETVSQTPSMENFGTLNLQLGQKNYELQARSDVVKELILELRQAGMLIA